MWGAIIAAGIQSYSARRGSEKDQERQLQGQRELTELTFRLRQEEKDRQRDYMRQGYAAYEPYGAGGAQDPFAQYRTQGRGQGLLGGGNTMNPGQFRQGLLGQQQPQLDTYQHTVRGY